MILDQVDTGNVPTFNIQEAKTHFSQLLARALAGEEVVIAKAGHPIARIVPVQRPPTERQPDMFRGKIWMSDDFDEPLPDDLLDAFEGRDD